jgi:hypothetical protein
MNGEPDEIPHEVIDDLQKEANHELLMKWVSDPEFRHNMLVDEDPVAYANANVEGGVDITDETGAWIKHVVRHMGVDDLVDDLKIVAF